MPKLVSIRKGELFGADQPILLKGSFSGLYKLHTVFSAASETQLNIAD
jgi:hypothetical protein